MYEYLSPAELILLAIDFVSRQVEIPSALACLIDEKDLKDIKNPESVCQE